MMVLCFSIYCYGAEAHFVNFSEVTYSEWKCTTEGKNAYTDFKDSFYYENKVNNMEGFAQAIVILCPTKTRCVVYSSLALCDTYEYRLW
jgi:hypothetical protein